MGSKLGWILAGRITGCSPSTTDQNLFVHSYTTSLSDSVLIAANDASLPVDPDMDAFWKLEMIGIDKPSPLTDDDIAIQQFKDTVKVRDNRYEVSWPWKVENPELPSNYHLALNHFRHIAKKFQSNPDLLKRYDDIIQDQIKQGIIEPVSVTTQEGPLKHYIPHHPVETPSKTTTKVRVTHPLSPGKGHPV